MEIGDPNKLFRVIPTGGHAVDSKDVAKFEKKEGVQIDA